MKTVGSLLVTLLLVTLGLVLGTAVILAWSLGIGWLLARLLPFSWFEASLLTIISSITVAYAGWRLLQISPPLSSEDGLTEDELSALFEPAISTDRFHEEGKSDQRAEVWFRYEIANDLYWEFENTPSIARSMDETEMKELAIRLTNIAVDLLKQRTSRARQVRVTKTQLERQMEKIEQRPYDDDILSAAVRSINDSLAADDELAEIVHARRWNEIEPDW
jgi:hypothetical protein